VADFDRRNVVASVHYDLILPKSRRVSARPGGCIERNHSGAVRATITILANAPLVARIVNGKLIGSVNVNVRRADVVPEYRFSNAPGHSLIPLAFAAPVSDKSVRAALAASSALTSLRRTFVAQVLQWPRKV